jgi:hypothetical protein
MHQRARVRETAPHRHKRTHGHTNAGRQLPAQVVTLAFVCAAALIDLSMVQAKRDPPSCRSRSRAKEASVCALIDGCPSVQLVPPSTTALVRGSMAARNAYANTTAALRCAMRYRHTATMSTIAATSAISEHSAFPALAPLRSRSLALA